MITVSLDLSLVPQNRAPPLLDAKPLQICKTQNNSPGLPETLYLNGAALLAVEQVPFV